MEETQNSQPESFQEKPSENLSQTESLEEEKVSQSTSETPPSPETPSQTETSPVKKPTETPQPSLFFSTSTN